jgi:hypothetical protein
VTRFTAEITCVNPIIGSPLALESMVSRIQSGNIGKGDMDKVLNLPWGWYAHLGGKNEFRIVSKESWRNSSENIQWIRISTTYSGCNYGFRLRNRLKS